MKYLTLLITFFTFTSFAQDLEPVIDYLRSTPAYIDGSTSFDQDSIVFDDNWTKVKIIKDQKIHFVFRENYLEVWPGDGFEIRCRLLKVKVRSVTWTPDRGVETRSELPADFTGLSQERISQEVAEIISTLFERKLRAANNLLKQVRSQKEIGGTMNIAKSMIAILTATNKPLGLSSYKGEIGLNFNPANNKAFNLNGMRISVYSKDNIRVGIKYKGHQAHSVPYALELTSKKGIDANQGKEWNAMARIVLSSFAINSKGTSIKMHLGASEVIQGVLTIAEIAARRRNPNISCNSCRDLASFPALRLRIETEMRKAVYSQIETLWPVMKNLKIQQSTYASFRRNESCNLKGLSCVEKCNRDINNLDDRKTCANRCEQRNLQCLR